MVALNLKYYGDRVLMKKAVRVEEITDRERSLVESMFETMHEACGIGLAAPQVGVSKRIIAIDLGQFTPSAKPIELINPEIVQIGEETVSEEGCLSLPGVRGVVRRRARVAARGLRLDGREIAFEADGLLARVLQHEVDHLDGLLFIDRLTPEQRRQILREFRELIKKGELEEDI